MSSRIPLAVALLIIGATRAVELRPPAQGAGAAMPETVERLATPRSARARPPGFRPRQVACFEDATSASSPFWGLRTAPPWIGTAHSENTHDLLHRPIHLERRGSPGDTQRWRIRRTNVSLDRQGSIAMRAIQEGEVDMTLARQIEPDGWAATIEWRGYASGQSMGSVARVEMERRPAVTGLTYPHLPTASGAPRIEADFSRAGVGMDAVSLRALALDVATWEPIVARLRDALGDSVFVGDVACWDPWERAEEIDDAGSVYRLGEMIVSVAGITQVRGEPAALLWFAAEGNELDQVIELRPGRVWVRGTESFRGFLALSLADGRILAGILSGPLVTDIRMSHSEDRAERPDDRAVQPISAVIQEVAVREIRHSPAR